jgi:uncharacterized membrane protein
MRELAWKKGCLLLASLGLWLLVAPISFAYTSKDLSISDQVTGIFLMGLAFFSLKKTQSSWIRLSACAGLWLQLAPLLFWAPEASSYLNDTFVGMIILILSFSLPGMSDEQSQEEIPPGWSFNPSAWGPRSVTVFLALICWFLARYLAAYQLGYIQEVKDPFFGNGSMEVISSSIAKQFPVSDAGLGAFGYSMEFFLGMIGGCRRWKTMPWLSIFFGAMVVPAGMISILLIILQPVLVGAFCGICLMIALCMLMMIVLTLPEVVAAVQLIKRVRRQKQSCFKVFWQGDQGPSSKGEKPFSRTVTSSLGFTLPWNLLLSGALGVFLMFSPYLFSLERLASDCSYIAGPLVFALSMISCSEVLRSLRLGNLIVGLSLVLSVFFLSGFSEEGFWSTLIVGILLFCLSFLKGTPREKTG